MPASLTVLAVQRLAAKLTQMKWQCFKNPCTNTHKCTSGSGRPLTLAAARDSYLKWLFRRWVFCTTFWCQLSAGPAAGGDGGRAHVHFAAGGADHVPADVQVQQGGAVRLRQQREAPRASLHRSHPLPRDTAPHAPLRAPPPLPSNSPAEPLSHVRQDLLRCTNNRHIGAEQPTS